jgi:hypothetical protein
MTIIACSFHLCNTHTHTHAHTHTRTHTHAHTHTHTHTHTTCAPAPVRQAQAAAQTPDRTSRDSPQDGHHSAHRRKPGHCTPQPTPDACRRTAQQPQATNLGTGTANRRDEHARPHTTATPTSSPRRPQRRQGARRETRTRARSSGPAHAPAACHARPT